MTDKERQEAIYCLARHFVVSHKQCINDEVSNIIEACVDCKLRKEGKCNPGAIKNGMIGWAQKSDALLRENGLAICFVCGVYESSGYEAISKAQHSSQEYKADFIAGKIADGISSIISSSNR